MIKKHIKTLAIKIFDAALFVTVFYSVGGAIAYYEAHRPTKPILYPVSMYIRCEPDGKALNCGIVFEHNKAVLEKQP